MLSHSGSKMSWIGPAVIFTALVILAINVLLIMVIWNNIIVKKFPNANIQRLNYWEALGIAVLCSILGGGGRVILDRCS
jgi:hypothetical protein